MEQDTRGVHISAGSGIVAHVGNLTAFATGEEHRLNELLVRLNALAGEPWTEIVRSLTSGISDAGYDDHPALACVSVEDDKVAALVFGPTSLSVSIDGVETILDGRDSSTWIDVALRGSIDRVHAGEQSDSVVVGVLRDGVIPAGGFLLDTQGPIPAAGRWSEIVGEVATDEQSQDAARVVEAVSATKELSPTEEAAPAVEEVAAPAEAMETTGASVEPADTTQEVAELTEKPVEADGAGTDKLAAAFGAVSEPADAPGAQRSMFARIEEVGRVSRSALANQNDTGADTPVAQSPFTSDTTDEASNESSIGQPSYPQIKGVECLEGHLTAPTEASCRTCGIALSADAASATGDRPTLGALTFDDGAVLNIDRPAVIGADVPVGYIIDDEPATLVRLDDGVGGVSPVHIEVRLSGWNVELVDMNTETGTFTLLGGERQTRTKLRANQAVLLQPNMEIQAGGRSFVFTVEQNATV